MPRFEKALIPPPDAPLTDCLGPRRTHQPCRDAQLRKAAYLAVTVDVEDWPQSTLDPSLPITERSLRNTERLLDLLHARNRKATFFVLGKFAERFPEAVRRMQAEGHEVASHGHGHMPIFRQSPAEFRADVSRSKKHLEDLVGQPVAGYRAPDFSITKASHWALDILADAGFEYDSSIYPIRHRRYGIPQWPTVPVNVRLPSGRAIVELPPATVSLLGRSWPVAGGGYHRLLPWLIIRWSVRRSLRQGQPFVSYCHPYEFDVHELRELPMVLPLSIRFHQGLGRRGFQLKFERLLAGFETRPAHEVALSVPWEDYHPQAPLCSYSKSLSS